MISRPIRPGFAGANVSRGWARDAHLPALRRPPRFVIAGPPASMAQACAQRAEDLGSGARALPGFEDKLRVTRLIEAIDVASETGRRQEQS